MNIEYVFKCKPFVTPNIITIDYLNEIYEKYKIIALVKILGINCEVTFKEED